MAFSFPKMGLPFEEATGFLESIFCTEILTLFWDSDESKIYHKSTLNLLQGLYMLKET